ncbi:MAG TPA: glycoside hydrolase family 5 protein, partial [Dehalococcoidia bacterium]|nr:glycoside hydrolase family 5 protein [Dehalococcoidia bacterium]
MASRQMARLACLAILSATAVIAAPQVSAAAAAPTIRVSGNHIVDANGNIVQLRGVNRSGAEYACAEGWGIW